MKALRLRCIVVVCQRDLQLEARLGAAMPRASAKLTQSCT